MPGGAINDGSTTTISHPLTDSGTLGFHFQVDLGRNYRLDRIVVRNREDGCCTERLSRYAIEVYEDSGGDPGRRSWNGAVRSDGSDSGVGGTDDDLPTLVIWHGKGDPRLQSQQQVEEQRDKTFSYLAEYRVAEKKFIRLADDERKHIGGVSRRVVFADRRPVPPDLDYDILNILRDKYALAF